MGNSMQEPPETTRKPTPRPQFRNTTHIKRENMVLHTWGDSVSGFVTDRVISSTKQLHVLEFELAPQGEFRHSSQNQTVFAADVLYFVVAGDLVLANPETGEVVLAKEGTGRLFHRGTWNHGFNPGQKTVRVIEYFSPPPAMGAASEFSRNQPALVENKYQLGKNVRNWPEGQAEMEAKASFLEISDKTAILSFRDSKPTHLIATLVATEFLKVVKGIVQTGHKEEFALVEKESVIYLLEGRLEVEFIEGTQGQKLILETGDAIFLPKGVKERISAQSSKRAVYLLGSGEVPDDWKP
ncbi:MAG: hypothetical protein O3A27_02845 [Actinomycetota bacterium]|nr:hypothetical protein [Actinomycetota bacterium]